MTLARRSAALEPDSAPGTDTLPAAGSPTLAASEGGLRALQAANLADVQPASEGEPASPASVSRYPVAGLLGRGGMGTVLAAEDPVLQRPVAVKVLRRGATASVGDTQRFLQEARITGRLQHPGIVPVHELGTDADGSAFYTMKPIEGVSLRAVIAGLRAGDPATLAAYPLSRLLGIFLRTCDAVAFAHSRGVIHRDLKPDNIMVGAFGEVLVLDWGLAKEIGGDEGGKLAAEGDVGGQRSEVGDTEHPSLSTEHRTLNTAAAEPVRQDESGGPRLTLDGAIMGTPGYMAPEQARGEIERLDRRTDIYALGAILHALLALRPPVEGESSLEILRRTAEGQVAPTLRRLVATPSGVSGERASAGGGPADGGKTLTTSLFPHCPGGRIPPALAAVALKALALAPADRYQTITELQAEIEAWQNGFATAAEQAGLWRQLLLLVRRHRVVASASLAVVLALALGLGIALVQWRGAVRARLAETRQRQAAESARGEAERARQAQAAAHQNLERENYISTIGLAEARIRECIIAEAEALLWRTPAALRNWEWGHLMRLCHPDLLSLEAGTRVLAVAFSPDGAVFLVPSRDSSIRVLDAATTNERLVLRGHTGPLHAAQFCPDGLRVVTASADKTARVWDLSSGREILRYTGHRGKIAALAVSRDSRRAATLDDTGAMDVWDLATGHRMHTLAGPKNHWYACLSFVDSTGARLLAPDSDRRLQYWDVSTGKPLGVALPGQGSVAVAPDGVRVASPLAGGGGRDIGVFSVNSGECQVVLNGHRSSIRALQFSHDGSRLLSASDDRTARAWDVNTGAELTRLAGHGGPVWAATFSPDDRLILTGSWDGTAKLWPTGASATPGVRRLATGGVLCLSVSPDGRYLVTGGDGGLVRQWDMHSGQAIAEFAGHTGKVWTAAFSADGGRLVTAGFDDRTARIWDMGTHRESLCLRGHRTELCGAAFSLDGRRMLTAGLDRTARVWDAHSGADLITLTGHSDIVTAAAFSPDGSVIATCEGGGVRLWDAGTGREPTLLQESSRSYALAFSRDGRRLAVGGIDGRLRLWDMRTHRLAMTMAGHAARVLTLQFSPDDHRLLTASEDMTAKLWDTETGREVLTFQEEGIVRAACVTSDGCRLVVGGFLTGVVVRDAYPWSITPEEIAQAQRVRYVQWLKEGQAQATNRTESSAPGDP